MDIGNMKNIKVDKMEFAKQEHERIRKTGNYAEVAICVEAGSSQVIPYCHACKCSTRDIAIMMDALKQVYKKKKKRYPEAAFYSNFMMKSRKEDL